jgi:hypothetical protein
MVMKKDEKNLLHVIQEAESLPPVPDATSAEEEIILKNEAAKKTGFELPSAYLMAKEMQALFEEDIVTHVQGPSEPEAD